LEAIFKKYAFLRVFRVQIRFLPKKLYELCLCYPLDQNLNRDESDMKSIFSVDILTWFGGLAVQTFLKAFLVLMLLNGFIDLALIRNLDSVTAKYILGGGLAACLLLAWVFLLWKTEPPILPRSILGVVPLLIGIGAFLVTGNMMWWWMVIIVYVGGAIWLVFFRAPTLRVAMQQWKAGNAEQAISVLDRYIESHPDANDAYQYRAWFLLEQAQYRKAEQDIQTALRLNPRSYLSHYLLGRILLGRGQISEARESLQAAVRLGPGRGISYFPLGITYHLQAEPLLAVEALCNGVGWGLPYASNYFVAYYYMGRNLDALGQSVSAARAYKQMARYWKGYYMLSTALQTDSSPESPTSKLYRADLSDMKRRMNLEI
jgi:predicted Zn-dependent protease